jgi:hypothetical protein
MDTISDLYVHRRTQPIITKFGIKSTSSKNIETRIKVNDINASILRWSVLKTPSLALCSMKRVSSCCPHHDAAAPRNVANTPPENNLQNRVIFNFVKDGIILGFPYCPA